MKMKDYREDRYIEKDIMVDTKTIIYLLYIPNIIYEKERLCSGFYYLRYVLQNPNLQY